MGHLFRRLNILYNSNLTTNATNLMNAPLYLARNGRVASGSLYNASNNGDYWSSTVYSLESAFGLYFNSSLTTPTNNPSRYAGFSLRCVLREFTYSVPGTGPNNDNTIPDGIDLTGNQNVGYASNALTTIMNTHPLYFIRSGNLSGTTLYSFGGNGSYWSSTVGSSNYAYYLAFNSGVLYPAYRNDRNGGRSLRCLSR